MNDGIPFTFSLISKHGSKEKNIPLKRLIIAGWTGRHKDKMEEHIDELEKLGVKRPATTPIFYRVSVGRLTQCQRIQTPGNASSGEVEFVLIADSGGFMVGVGSDHTDREVETYGITVSKQMCDKPIARDLWSLAEVMPHWDRLQLKSYAFNDGKRRLYQDGGVAGMLAPDTLLAKLRQVEGTDIQPGDIIMGGTMPVIGGLKSADRFEFEIIDPVLGRTISHGYDVETLPVNG